MGVAPSGGWPGALLGNPDESRTQEPFVIGIAGQNHLGDGPRLAPAALYLEHRLVTAGVERLAEGGLDACDPVLRERVLQSPFAGSHPTQQAPQRLVLIRRTRRHTLQRT